MRPPRGQLWGRVAVWVTSAGLIFFLLMTRSPTSCSEGVDGRLWSQRSEAVRGERAAEVATSLPRQLPGVSEPRQTDEAAAPAGPSAAEATRALTGREEPGPAPRPKRRPHAGRDGGAGAPGTQRGAGGGGRGACGLAASRGFAARRLVSPSHPFFCFCCRSCLLNYIKTLSSARTVVSFHPSLGPSCLHSVGRSPRGPTRDPGVGSGVPPGCGSGFDARRWGSGGPLQKRVTRTKSGLELNTSFEGEQKSPKITFEKAERCREYFRK